MAAADCLLNCLREVHLERFHRNFTERGLINCEQLSSLLVSDYGQFGIVSTDDKRRLFQLIHIIKSVQADGVSCGHGIATVTTSQPQVQKVQQPTKQNVPISVPARRKEELPDVTRNGVIPACKTETAGCDGTVECPKAPSRQFIKPISNECNYRVQYEQPPEKVRLHITEETKVVAKNRGVTTDDSVGTPKFNCRKMLNFSDSDLYSDDYSGNSCFRQPAIEGTSSQPLLPPQSNNSVTSLSPESKASGLRPPQVVATTCLSSPRAFVIPTEKKPVVRHHSSGSHQSPADSQRGFHGVLQNGHPTKKSSFRNDDSRRHAYFPTAKIPPPGELPTHVEQIYHRKGYNYGIPGSTTHSVDKVLCSYLLFVHYLIEKDEIFVLVQFPMFFTFISISI